MYLLEATQMFFFFLVTSLEYKGKTNITKKSPYAKWTLIQPVKDENFLSKLQEAIQCAALLYSLLPMFEYPSL